MEPHHCLCATDRAGAPKAHRAHAAAIRATTSSQRCCWQPGDAPHPHSLPCKRRIETHRSPLPWRGAAFKLKAVAQHHLTSAAGGKEILSDHYRVKLSGGLDYHRQRLAPAGHATGCGAANASPSPKGATDRVARPRGRFHVRLIDESGCIWRQVEDPVRAAPNGGEVTTKEFRRGVKRVARMPEPGVALSAKARSRCRVSRNGWLGTIRRPLPVSQVITGERTGFWMLIVVS
jgi:hypothetical protein